MKKQNQTGFSIIEILVVIVALCVIGGVAWYVWKLNVSKTNDDKVTTSKVATKTMTLADESVSFSVPETWQKGAGVGCVEGAPIFGNEKVLDSVTVLAGKQDDTSKEPYFAVVVCVFDNTAKMTPQEWANATDGGASIGYPSDKDKASDSPINGESAYYMKLTAEEHNGNEDVYYVIASKDKIVYVSSRIRYDYTSSEYDGTEYEPYGGNVYDFRQYETAVTELANSVSVK